MKLYSKRIRTPHFLLASMVNYNDSVYNAIYKKTWSAIFQTIATPIAIETIRNIER